ncbi:MAG: TatD family hydrolase [Bacteroidales bacterium]|nr:TatD family hydrolase [Bacteroidales bacterium]
MIDTHTHLYLPEFDADGGGRAAVERAIAAGVTRMVFPNVDRTSVEPMRALAAQFSGTVSMAIGLHPTEVRENWREELDFHMAELRKHVADYVAVGEIGIDLYWDKTFRSEQMQALDEQFALADELCKPVIIHCREGLDETLEVMQGHPGLRAVFHSFGGTADDVERIRRHGDHYLGINGIVTFKNSRLRDVLPAIGIERILTETDAPYLAPVPHRGKRNESAFITETGKAIAGALGIGFDDMDLTTSRNAITFFDLK